MCDLKAQALQVFQYVFKNLNKGEFVVFNGGLYSKICIIQDVFLLFA